MTQSEENTNEDVKFNDGGGKCGIEGNGLQTDLINDEDKDS